MPEIIIIGAGLTGTSLGYFLKKDFVILEKEKVPGGLCRSIKIDGFTFDYSGHFLHLHQNKTKQLLKNLLENNLREIQRKSWIYEFDRFIPFPFQANLYYLPEKIKKECLQGFIHRPKRNNQNFYNWSLSTFGSGITKHFMKPYNEKLWTVSSKILSSDWAAPFVPQPALKDIINGTRNKQTKSFGYNEYFFYPIKGGIQSIADAFCEKVSNIKLGTSCLKIDYKRNIIEASNGKKYNYQFLVSTQPLVKLLESIINLPGEIRSAAEKLRWNSVVCFNVGVKEDGNSKLAGGKHWIYIPEKKYPFYRVGFYKNIMPSSCPKNASSMYIEVSHRPNKKINK
ncbi:MAG: FAD-dependent oxidoreductase, partial [Elusimicrobia bacterium]|nr:FAD-dependent oxidoreductase [Elusimicrobiota bacterium]